MKKLKALGTTILLGITMFGFVGCKGPQEVIVEPSDEPQNNEATINPSTGNGGHDGGTQSSEQNNGFQNHPQTAPSTSDDKKPSIPSTDEKHEQTTPPAIGEENLPTNPNPDAGKQEEIEQVDPIVKEMNDAYGKIVAELNKTIKGVEDGSITLSNAIDKIALCSQTLDAANKKYASVNGNEELYNSTSEMVASLNAKIQSSATTKFVFDDYNHVVCEQKGVGEGHLYFQNSSANLPVSYAVETPSYLAYLEDGTIYNYDINHQQYTEFGQAESNTSIPNQADSNASISNWIESLKSVTQIISEQEGATTTLEQYNENKVSNLKGVKVTIESQSGEKIEITINSADRIVEYNYTNKAANTTVEYTFASLNEKEYKDNFERIKNALLDLTVDLRI